MKSTNEKLFAILDKLFPGEFSFKANSSYLKPVLRHNTRIDPIIEASDLVDAFWLAEKVGLFDEYFLMKFEDEWQVREVQYNDVYLGKTPQEAIVNAIIEIYGEE